MTARTRARARTTAVYLGAAALSIAIAFPIYDLGKADLSVPFLDNGDALVQALTFKSVIENGWYLTVPQLGAPGRLHFHDFPVADTLHLVVVKVMARFSRDWAVLFNLYFLLGFPLITVSALAVFRHFRVPVAPAIAAAILYSFLPSRILKGEAHIFLDVFYQVPPLLLAALWACGADPPLVRDRGPGRWPSLEIRRARSILAVLFCVAGALGGLYYAFFATFALVVGGVWASVDRRAVHNAISAFLLAAVILLTSAVNALPSLVYVARHGKNLIVAHRLPQEAEFYALKIIQLLLPIEGHRVPVLRAFNDDYRLTAPLVGENDLVSLGVMGSIGFLTLLAMVMSRPRPENPRSELWRTLGVLNLSVLLLGTLGGFGALFARLVSPNLRTYCRTNVIIAFLALFALALLLERLGRRKAWLAVLVSAVVLAVGILDQVPLGVAPPYAENKAEFTAFDRYVRAVEASLPRNAMVFQLPFAPFPEEIPPGQMMSYDQLRPYLHSHTLRWSQPVMRGRADDVWTRNVADEPPEKMIDDLSAVDFGGIFIDRAGYADRGAAIEAVATRVLETPPYVSRDKRFAFFNLQPYKAHPRQQLTPELRAAHLDMALHPLVVDWDAGWHGLEVGPQGMFRWSAEVAKIAISNPTTHPKTVFVSMTLVPGRNPCQVTVDGDLLPQPFTTAQPALFERKLDVLPGAHLLRVRADCQPVDAPNDKRRLVVRADNPIVREVPRP